MTNEGCVEWRCIRCGEPFDAPDAQTATCPYCETMLKIPDEAWEYYQSDEKEE